MNFFRRCGCSRVSIPIGSRSAKAEAPQEKLFDSAPINLLPSLPVIFAKSARRATRDVRLK